MTFFLVEEAGNKVFCGYFEGDDGIVFFDKCAPAATAYRELGAKIKIEIPSDLCEASFCGLIFDVVAKDNVCDPLETLMSFGWTTSQYANSCNKKLKALLRSKSLSMLYSYPGCPILKECALYGLRMTAEITDSYLEQVVSKMRVNEYQREKLRLRQEHFDKISKNSNEVHAHMIDRPIHQNSRNLVQKKFNISLDAQEQCENYFKNKNDLSPINLPVLLNNTSADCQHYFENYGMYVTKSGHKSFSTSAGRKYKIWQRGGPLMSYKLVM
jgi:hypothetical protein